MSSAIPQNANVYTELSSLKSLKGQLKSGDKTAIEKVAQQFEAIFLQMMLTGMRKTIQVDDDYSNDKSMYYDLFDKQIAVNLSEKGGIGLAKMMMQQSGLADMHSQDDSKAQSEMSIKTSNIMGTAQTLSANTRAAMVASIDNSMDTDKASTVSKLDNVSEDMPNEITKDKLKFNGPHDFIQTVWDVARDVIMESGFDPKVVIAQAALETGWGKHIIRTASGDSSFNLFGIKSSRQWKGEQAMANTLEYKDGMVYQAREGFRAYGSIRESVSDYIDFLKSNQRYKKVLQQLHNPQAYMRELQEAGYATDPQYANKVLKILDRKEFGDIFAANGAQQI